MGQFNTIPPNPFPPSSEKVGDAVEIEKDIASIKEDITSLETDVENLNVNKANQITIAPFFNAETSYNVGDIVYYNGFSYRCTNAHEGAWDADDFAATTISNELNSLMSGLTNTDNKATTAYNSRISISTFFDDSIDKIITFSGKAHCRMASFLLIPASQSSVCAPIVISFTGTAGYDNIYGVVVSANTCGVTANGLTVTAPKLDDGWGYYTLINLYPDAELTYTVTAAI